MSICANNLFSFDGNHSMCVYSITHIVTGKTYIGQTTLKARRRWSRHICQKDSQGRSAIKSAIGKYGKESFAFSVIDIAESQKQLDYKEIFWISKMNTLSPNGYNLGMGGNGKGKVSAETCKKISAAKRGITTARKGTKLPREWVEKMRTTKTGVAVPAKYKPIIRCDGTKYESLQDVVAKIGCHRGTLNSHLKGRLKTIYGMKYSYKAGV